MKIGEKGRVAVTGAAIGAAAVILTALGNPGNMGFCIACFLRDTAGALHLHTAAAVEYVRPEIIGIVLGSFAVSAIKGDFRARAGSAPVLRFIIGAIVMIGALVFLGCPLRMVLRLGGGDLNALSGLLGFAAGIGIGCFFLSHGFSLGRTHEQKRLEGAAFPAMTILLFILFLGVPSIFLSSQTGPGSMRAPVVASLAAGLIAGVLAERSRLCFAGGIRDAILIKDYTLLTGFLFVFIASLIANLIAGTFSLGFEGQPIAHSKQIWNFLGMLAAGLGSVMLGGCPLRQLIMAGEGSADSASAVFGMIFGAALAHNFSLASAAVEGPGMNGKVALSVGIVILVLIGYMMCRRNND